MNKTAQFSAFLLAVLVAACSVEPPAEQVEQHTRHALVIGIDGVRPDALQAAQTPNFDRLVKEGVVSWDAFAGGGAAAGDPTQQATSSGPGWSSILTGVWVDRHQVRDNNFEDNDLANHPHFFARIREEHADASLASIVNWNPINEHILQPFPGLASLQREVESDVLVEERAVAELHNPGLDVLFLHFDEVDGAGHGSGYGVDIPEYITAIEKVDQHLGRVLDGLESRDGYEQEDWLVLLTTDHGGLDKGHGGQSDDERKIWIIARAPGMQSGIVSPGPGHTVIARTVLEHLGVPILDEWHLADSAAFGSAEKAAR